jgi:H+/gluconate symporter-like permease
VSEEQYKRIKFLEIYNTLGSTASITGITFLWLDQNMNIKFDTLTLIYIIVSVIVSLGVLSYAVYIIQRFWESLHNHWEKKHQQKIRANPDKSIKKENIPITVKISFISLVVPLILLCAVIASYLSIRTINTVITEMLKTERMTLTLPNKENSNTNSNSDK